MEEFIKELQELCDKHKLYISEALDVNHFNRAVIQDANGHIECALSLEIQENIYGVEVYES